MKKKSITALVVIIIIAIVMLLAYKVYAPKALAGSKNITVIVNHLKGDENKFVFSTDAEYLRGALEEQSLVSGPETEYGLWVETVDGEKADDSKEEWWGYTVNGEFAAYGVDEQIVSDGDVYEFTLNVGY